MVVKDNPWTSAVNALVKGTSATVAINQVILPVTAKIIHKLFVLCLTVLPLMRRKKWLRFWVFKRVRR